MSSLLEQIQGLIERTYDLSTGIDDIGAFVIGDTGWRVLYAGSEVTAHVTSAQPGADLMPVGRPLQPVASLAVSPPAAREDEHLPATARTLVKQDGERIRLSVYFPDSLIDHLEKNPPLRSLGEENIDAFATFVEELDHLLHIAHRARLARKLTLLELEWQANVTKFQVIRHLMARRLAPRPAGLEVAHWARYHLFEKFEYAEDNLEAARRYREAVRLAIRTLNQLELLSPQERLTKLRAFAHQTFAEKMRAVER